MDVHTFRIFNNEYDELVNFMTENHWTYHPNPSPSIHDINENSDGSVSDSLCYAIIRKDWENKIVTPIKLEDLP
ncbi:hypothetical protein NST02_05770 [Robertmurraya sp. FSL W8-0741]|uniref:hypothetical protein n=1 Tax=Robertmurraya sp. FSL W8-0741 TaxID=2954629 RepID=UPI0030F54198